MTGFGLCCTCLDLACFKNLWTKYTWMGRTEVYGDMLKECFNLTFPRTQYVAYQICQMCITELRSVLALKRKFMQSLAQIDLLITKYGDTGIYSTRLKTNGRAKYTVHMSNKPKGITRGLAVKGNRVVGVNVVYNSHKNVKNKNCDTPTSLVEPVQTTSAFGDDGYEDLYSPRESDIDAQENFLNQNEDTSTDNMDSIQITSTVEDSIYEELNSPGEPYIESHENVLQNDGTSRDMMVPIQKTSTVKDSIYEELNSPEEPYIDAREIAVIQNASLSNMMDPLQITSAVQDDGYECLNSQEESDTDAQESVVNRNVEDTSSNMLLYKENEETEDPAQTTSAVEDDGYEDLNSPGESDIDAQENLLNQNDDATTNFMDNIQTTSAVNYMGYEDLKCLEVLDPDALDGENSERPHCSQRDVLLRNLLCEHKDARVDIILKLAKERAKNTKCARTKVVPVNLHFPSSSSEKEDDEDYFGDMAIQIAKKLKEGVPKLRKKYCQNKPRREPGELREIEKTVCTRVPRFILADTDFTKDGEHYLCAQCPSRIRNKQSFLKHVKNKHYLLKYHCKYCDQRFETEVMVTLHKLQEHSIDERFKCNACDRVFNSQFRMRRHYRVYHLLGVKEKCGKCDYETYDKKVMINHRIVHEKDKTMYKCGYCTKSFPRPHTRRMHERIHTGEKRKVCKLCGQRFVQKASLNYHMMKHHPGEV